MKKMMIAAAAAALVGGAFAASCVETCTETCPFGYRLKVMVRTTGPCALEQNACGECADTYRKPVIRRFMGMVYGTTATEEVAGTCGEKSTKCGCNKWDNAYVALYDYDKQAAAEIDSAELLQLNRIGCLNDKKDKVEMCFKLNLTCGCADAAEMTFAGFGTCGIHNDQITVGSVQGYCAGLLPPAMGVVDNGPCKDPTTTCVTTKAWNLCCDTDFTCPFTAAYGKWTLTWDSSIADKVGIALSQTEAKTAWGTAKAAQLADKRNCAEPECATCGCAD